MFVAPLFYCYPHSRIYQKLQNLSFTTVWWYCRRIFLIVTRETIIENLSVLIFLLHGQDCRNANLQRQGITIDKPELQALQHVYKRSDKAMRIDCIVGEYDEIDVVYIAYYDGNRRLFHCFENHDNAVGYYVIVAEYDDEKHHRRIYNKLQSNHIWAIQIFKSAQRRLSLHSLYAQRKVLGIRRIGKGIYRRISQIQSHKQLRPVRKILLSLQYSCSQKTFLRHKSLTLSNQKNRKAVFCFLYVTRETII